VRARVEEAARHRYAVTVRADGLAAVLDPLLLRGRGVAAAALVDVDSGMVLDTWPPPDEDVASGADRPTADPWPVHAELLRVALRLAPAGAVERADGAAYEVVVQRGADLHHVVALVPDPHGGWLGLAVEVRGSRRALDRARRRMRAVPRPALTAGPTTARRPRADGGWGLLMSPPPGPPAERSVRVGPGGLPGSLFHPVRAPGGPAPQRPVAVAAGAHDGRPAPPSALPPPRR